ncbi:hypothetical protein V8G54_014619 [Vigna mungo]|uniref:Transcription factor IIIC subunit 5 HTH domain-containing protein n=1 Tax=Vigna mungo TaxID=3915 RepID=A0AAQ3RW42_VIGMU
MSLCCKHIAVFAEDWSNGYYKYTAACVVSGAAGCGLMLGFNCKMDMEMEPVLALDFDIKDILLSIGRIIKVNWEEYIPQGSDQWELQMVVSGMFDERPIWSKNSLTERLHKKGLSFSHGMLRRLLSRISYYFSSGPFLRFWIKKGYDPRKDPNSRM